MYTRLNFICGQTSISKLIELAFYNLLSKGGLPEDIIKSSEGESPTICKFASSVILLPTQAGRLKDSKRLDVTITWCLF